MIKSEFIMEIAQKTPYLSLKKVNEGVQHLLDQMSNTLKNDGRIEIRGFGSFSVTEKAPRTAHNPKTKEKIKTKKSKSVHFKPGRALKERVNLERKKYPIIESL